MTKLSAASVRSALRFVFDPELGLNIVDLGLVRDISVQDGHVTVQMTLSTPACPLAGTIVQGVEQAVRAFEAVTDVDVQLVWDPPWSPEQISPEGRRQLGW